MKLVGSLEQERRLEEMGQLAHEVFPKVEIVVFKGLFRSAIEAALKEQGIGAWQELTSKDAESKRLFFSSVLEFASERLFNLGLSSTQEEKIKALVKDRIFHEISFHNPQLD